MVLYTTAYVMSIVHIHTLYNQNNNNVLYGHVSCVYLIFKSDEFNLVAFMNSNRLEMLPYN